MKTHHLVATRETVEDFIRLMHTEGRFDIGMPWDMNKEYPESGDLLVIHCWRESPVVFAWVRTVAPGHIDELAEKTRIRRLDITAGKPLPVRSFGRRRLPPPT